MEPQPLKNYFRIWTILLIVIPSFVIMAIYTAGQIKVAKEKNLELISQVAHSQERLIDYWMEERARSVREISQDAAFRTLDEQQMKSKLALKQQADNNFDSLSYINKDGYFVFSTLNQEIQYPSVIGKPYFEAANAGKEYISDVVIGRNSGMPIINFSSPIYDYNGNLQGLILGSVRTTTLETLLRESWIGQTGDVFLINRNGIMLTEPRGVDKLTAMRSVEDTARMRLRVSDDAIRNIRMGDSGTAGWVDYLGNKVLGAYIDMPERRWTLIGKIDEAELLAPIYTQLEFMAASTLFLILLILPLANLLTNRIKHPINWLIEKSNLVAAENYLIDGNDNGFEKMPHELGKLCKTFMKMSRKIEKTVGLLKENEISLESTIAEMQEINATLEEEVIERQRAEAALTKLNDDLENKVRERTRELQDMNAALEEEIAERLITEKALRENRDELAVSEERYRMLFDNMLHGLAYCKMIFVDEQPRDFVYLAVNEAFETVTGLHDVIGKRVTEVVPGIKDVNLEMINVFGRVSMTGVPETFEQYIGALKEWMLISVYSTSRGHFVALFDNITDRKNTEADIRRIAYFDTLTGLPNRARLSELLEAEMAKARKGESAGAVLFIDLDDLKMVNDSFGHTYGDELIIMSGNRIVEVFRDNAFVSRIGGDEFMVILPGQYEKGRITEVAEAFIDALSQDIEILGVRFHVSASVGIAIYPVDGDTVEEIFKNADNAMYAAKNAGKSCWRFYETNMQVEAYDKVLLTNSLRYAIERGELILHYQPQVGLDCGTTIGFEALLRWNSLEYGTIPPARFIPLAEQAGLIHTIGNWVVHTACQFASRLADQGLKHIHVAVNVSPYQLCADGFTESIRDAIGAAGIEPCQLELEITENALLNSIEDCTRKLNELRAIGVRLSLDDFGTGYSSLTYLQRLPVNTLKIDKAFIDMILAKGAQKAIIGNIVDMAHRMEMIVVAEGVETAQQLEYVARCGCDLLQGYIISHPVPEEEAIHFLLNTNWAMLGKELRGIK